MAHTLPPLPYPYDALEPSISREIMELHHTKHHQTYVNALNAAEAAYAKASTPKERIALQAALKFNGGGHINHSLFWRNLAPSGSGDFKADSPLGKKIIETFKDLKSFQEQFNSTAAAIQGSGWCWLGYNPATKGLEIVTTANQDPLLTHIPIIGVDMWEHAFYLQYKNVKPEYLKAIWSVINWEEAGARFGAAKSNL